jgi:hypothetical protein
LWLGSGEGLYRFDGFTFERVRAIDGDSPAPTEVFALLATSNGDLWIGTSYSGAILLRNGVAKRFPEVRRDSAQYDRMGFCRRFGWNNLGRHTIRTPALRWLTMAFRRLIVAHPNERLDIFAAAIEGQLALLEIV